MTAGGTGGEAAAGDVLRAEQVWMSFGAVTVLRGIDLHLRKGEVLGLVGDNGAGKSTLVKILSGLFPPDGGRLFVDEKRVRLRSVRDAGRHGIETVFQDLALVDELSVYHNLFLNREHKRGGPLCLLGNKSMRAAARRYLDDIKVDIPVIDAPVAQLSGGQRQAIAVARATRQDSIKILILDEPLAAMGAKESSVIIELVKNLVRLREISIIIVDHNYTHLFELCDRVNVIQEGRVTLDKRVRDTNLAELTNFMVESYRRQVGIDMDGAGAGSVPEPVPASERNLPAGEGTQEE